jgi:hypothetical protein
MNRFQTYRSEVDRLLARVAPVLALLVAFTALCLILPSFAPAFGSNTSSSSAQLGQKPNPNATFEAKAVSPPQETWRRPKKVDQGYEAWGRNWRWYFGVPEYGESAQ